MLATRLGPCPAAHVVSVALPHTLCSSHTGPPPLLKQSQLCPTPHLSPHKASPRGLQDPAYLSLLQEASVNALPEVLSCDPLPG